jgi:hypothetical protein
MQVKVHEAGIWYHGKLGSNRQVTSVSNSLWLIPQNNRHMSDHKKGVNTERGVFFLDAKGEEMIAFVDVRHITEDTYVVLVLLSSIASTDLVPW